MVENRGIRNWEIRNWEIRDQKGLHVTFALAPDSPFLIPWFLIPEQLK